MPLIQQANNTFTASATCVVTISAPAAGNCLVAFSVNDNVVITGITGGGVTWVVGQSHPTHLDIAIWYGPNSSGSGTSVTVTYTNNTGKGGVIVAEFSTVLTSSPLDVAPTGSAGITTNPITPTAVTTNAVDLLVALAGYQGVPATTAGPTNSFTALTEVSNVNKVIAAYREVTSTGSYTTDWTEGGSATGWDTVIVALKEVSNIVDEDYFVAPGPMADNPVVTVWQ